VVPQNDVVVGGVPVGKVTSVKIAPDDGSTAGATVVMQIDRGMIPLHRGTRATIRPKGVLGNMFVELSPVSSGAVIPSGGALPLEDTATPVDLDQVMDLFDPQTRQRIQTLTREGGAGLNGEGADLNLFLSQLPAITNDTAAATGKIAERDQQLSALNVEFDRIAAMIVAEDQAFRRDLANGATLLDTMAAHQQRLRDEILFASLVFAELEGGLKGHEADLNKLLKEMPSLLDQLRATSNSSSTSLSIIGPCMNDIINALAEMRDAFSYRAQDGSGNMLRVDTKIPNLTTGPETGTDNQGSRSAVRAACGGSK
jgi:phospholipid/cholesterol/gamma-HCH transport system substrate-binding protein